MVNFITGGHIIYDRLVNHNVKHVFLYSGGAIMNLIDQFYDGPIKYFINTHEQSSGHAATGYAKSSGQTGVCAVTSGPGLTNMITPMLDATNDSTPLVVFSGQVPRAAMGSQAFQECPAIEITRPVTKWSYCVENVDELPCVVDQAFKIANHKKKGTVHIDLPKCVLNATVLRQPFYKYNSNIKDINNTDLPPTYTAHDFNNVIDLIYAAKKPILYVGQGCNNAYKELRVFAKKYNIPVTTTIHALGAFDENDPLSLQMVGMHGNAAANYAIQEADLIIALGARFDDRTTGALEHYAPEAFKAYKEDRGGIVHVNIEHSELHKVVPAHYEFCLDCEIFLREINRTEESSTISINNKWIDKIQQWKKQHYFQYKPANNKKIKGQDVISEINKQITSDYIITTGVGNHQMYAAQFIKWGIPNSMITSGSLGVMGVGLPYAIGCQIANPDKMVIDIDGDGSFHHTLAELKTVRDYNLPIKIAIMNDGHMSMVRVWEQLFFKGRYTATTLSQNPDYISLANSFGIKAIYCDNIDDLDEKINYFLTYPGAILCDFRIKTDMCLPLVGPGKALDNMILTADNVSVSGSAPN